jgi:hypothetical protein
MTTIIFKDGFIWQNNEARKESHLSLSVQQALTKFHVE